MCQTHLSYYTKHVIKNYFRNPYHFTLSVLSLVTYRNFCIFKISYPSCRVKLTFCTNPSSHELILAIRNAFLCLHLFMGCFLPLLNPDVLQVSCFTGRYKTMNTAKIIFCLLQNGFRSTLLSSVKLLLVNVLFSTWLL